MSIDIEIEIATTDTVAEAVPLLALQFDEHRIELDETLLEDAVRGLVEGRGRILLAREGSNVIGIACLSYQWTLEHGGKIAWLEELYVVPARRATGVGTKLLHRAMEVVKGDGCLAMDLEVDVDHVRAENLYRREGFKELPRRRFAKKL